jgi:primary-amine oxidase
MKRLYYQGMRECTVNQTIDSHPLALLTADEIAAARETLQRSGLAGSDVRFAYLGLEEPSKDELYGAGGAAEPERRIRAFLLDVRTGASVDALVNLTRGVVERHRALDLLAEGQLPVLLEEFDAIEAILAVDEGWRSALRDRGLEPHDVKVAPLSAGVFDYPGEENKRLLRGLAFQKQNEGDHPWAHPIDNLVVFVDMITRRVDRIIDHGAVVVPAESGNYTDPEVSGQPRTSLRVIDITQPDGPSFTLEGNELSWENWKLRVGFDAREGLVLHSLGFYDRDRQQHRPVIHRASIAEMLVPYGDPSPFRSWQNYFDTGEYLVGRDANSLELGCDCLGSISYLSPTIADDFGNPRVIPNAVCIHEEDAGILWKHTDEWAGSRETRRQRRLVISFFTTVGNYDYGFYWHLYLDGTIEFEAKATGIVFTVATPREDYEYASEIAPGLSAPFHQHLFCARLDMMVDGFENRVDELEVARLPVSDSNPHGNAFTRSRRTLPRESDAGRFAERGLGRVWEILNPASTNRLGQPVAFTLFPEGNPALLAADDSSIAGRAGFATRHLWVTPYDSAERYPAGDFVNRSPAGSGLPTYSSADRPIDNTDLVVWHTFGLTHFPRTEDWPIMPVDRTGFTLKPTGFFDRNPTLDVPSSIARIDATSGMVGSACCHEE